MALLCDVQDRNLLGDQASPLGPKCNPTPFKMLDRLSVPNSILNLCFFDSPRAGATRLEAASAASITSFAIQTARTATDVDQLVNCVVTAAESIEPPLCSHRFSFKCLDEQLINFLNMCDKHQV